MRIFMAINCAVLLGLTVWLLSPALSGNADSDKGPGSTTSTQPSASPPPVLTKQEVMAQAGKWFGLSIPKAPHSEGDLNRVSQAAGSKPNMLQYFVRWDQEFNPALVEATYRQGQLPVVSWEPWDGKQFGNNQPKYALSKIINGDFDKYLTRFATAVRNNRVPIAIRLAHEMNGRWYPWNEQQSGNQPGQYAKAWQHTHDIFKKVGAQNVIWIWSPNILRPVPNVSLSALYPGDAYVDWIGMVGYGVNESTASVTFDPTLKAVRKFTQKPMVITETGTQPGSLQVAWIKDFFKWMAKQPSVIGFIWFEYSKEQGGTADWRFSHRADTSAAFKTGLATLQLIPTPNPRPIATAAPTASPAAG